MLSKKSHTTRALFTFGLTTLFATLNGCDNSKTHNDTSAINCSDEAGISSVIATISDSSEASIKDERNDISLSSIRASLSTLNMSAQNIRTSKVDPNSTKVFCEAEITINPPINLINDANTSLKNSNGVEITDIGILLENIGLNPSRTAANSYESTINYSLQPTDDGKTVVSTIEGGDAQLVSGITELILLSMAKTSPVNTPVEVKTAQNAVMEAQPVNTTATQPSAASTSHPSQKTHLQCSIGNTVASKPCLVSEEEAIANTPLTAKYFGQNGTYRQITIVWPDNDVSRYAVVNEEQLLNLRKPNSGYYHLDYPRNGQIILNDGLNILRDGKPYISLW